MSELRIGCWRFVRCASTLLSRCAFRVYMFGNRLSGIAWEQLPNSTRYLINERHRQQKEVSDE